MPTDVSGSSGTDFPLRLDEIPDEEAVCTELRLLEQRQAKLVFVDASLDQWERIKTSLLALRAANISTILRLTNGSLVPTLEELEYVASFLRDWDQLFIHNILSLCGEALPEHARKQLEFESKLEIKWFREWLTANQSEKISSVPGLPWRSFIRRTISENYQFAISVIRYGAPGSPQRSPEILEQSLAAFLKSKKKAINIFPKRWGKLQ